MGLCVHWGLRGISTSSGSSALSARRALRARRSDFSAQRKKKMIAARIAKSTAAESQYFSSGFDAFLLMTSHWFEPLGTWGQRPTKYKTARPWTWAMWPPARTRLAPHAIAATVRDEFQAPTLHP